MNNLLRLGTDAEYFVAGSDGIVSAIDKIGGSKESPLIVPYGNLQEDNVLAEFAIDPVSNRTDWVNNIRMVISNLRGHMGRHKLNLVCRSSHHYDKSKLLSFGPMAMELGCQPDFNVYTQQENEKPNALTTLRTAAAHIHFSYSAPTQDKTSNIIKALDYCLGVWSVLEDEDKDRRQLYGKAGSCRIKDYGGEYRTLGNFWLRNQEYMEYVYDTTCLCVKYADELLMRLRPILNEENLQGIINGYDNAQAGLIYGQISRVMAEVENAQLSK